MAEYIIEAPIELTVVVPDDVKLGTSSEVGKVRPYTIGELLGPLRRWLQLEVTYLGEGKRIHDELFGEGEGPRVVASSWSGELAAYEAREDDEPRLVLVVAPDEGEEGLDY